MSTINIKIEQPVDDRMGASFGVLMKVMPKFEAAKPGDIINVDISLLNFVYPLLLLPLSVLIQDAKQKAIKVNLNNSACDGYLKTISFPSGWNPKEFDDWNERLIGYSNKSYVPVLAIPTKEVDINYREQTLTHLGNLLRKQTGISGQLYTAFSYLITEIFDNIIEHASVDNG